MLKKGQCYELFMAVFSGFFAAEAYACLSSEAPRCQHNLLEFPLKLNKGERCFQVHRPPPLLSIANTHPKDNRSSASFSSQNHYLPSETGMPTKISDMTGMAQLLAMQL